METNTSPQRVGFTTRPEQYHHWKLDIEGPVAWLRMKVSEDDKNRWYRHWVETGLEVVERRLAADPATGAFCHGDSPTLADCVLVPQIHNAQRMDCRLDHVPTVMRVFGACMQHDAFAKTQPSVCPDAA